MKNKKAGSINDDFKLLEELVSKLSSEQDNLEESIGLFKQGVEVVKRLKTKLTKAKVEVEQIQEELETAVKE
ncbi:MAG: exodeoxyribonuclease VII small subunit [bacterium]|nr:exodeoxyribonuclease VII small subunit [bacterium]